MDENRERRRYYPGEENAPLSQTVLEAVEAHDDSSLTADEFQLFDHVDPEAIDMLFRDTAGFDISVQFDLTNVTVSIWSDGGVDVRVTDKME